MSQRARPADLVARVLVAPPVAMFDSCPSDGTRTLVLVPEHDQYGGPQAVRAALAGWSSTAIEVVNGADHFLAGAISPIAVRAVEWLTADDQTA